MKLHSHACGTCTFLDEAAKLSAKVSTNYEIFLLLESFWIIIHDGIDFFSEIKIFKCLKYIASIEMLGL